jgi:hypothetical protein
MADWCVQTPTTQEKAESEGEVWTGAGASRPPTIIQEKAESEKVRYGGLGVQPYHTREGQRARR